MIATLELQQEFEGNETINETLAEESFADLSTIIATAAITEERAEGLQNESERLEAESEDLEARGEALEEDREELEAEQASVESRGAFMAETLNETRELPSFRSSFRSRGSSDRWRSWGFPLTC